MALVRAAPVFAALGDETRLGLVVRLSSGGPLSIARLTEGLHVSRQAVTKHLRVLEEAGLARATRVGRDSVWEMQPGRLDEARKWLSHIEGQWDDALGRLKRQLEGKGPNQAAKAPRVSAMRPPPSSSEPRASRS